MIDDNAVRSVYPCHQRCGLATMSGKNGVILVDDDDADEADLAHGICQLLQLLLGVLTSVVGIVLQRPQKASHDVRVSHWSSNRLWAPLASCGGYEAQGKKTRDGIPLNRAVDLASRRTTNWNWPTPFPLPLRDTFHVAGKAHQLRTRLLRVGSSKQESRNTKIVIAMR